MDKELLDIANDLSKKPTTELALQIMELCGENLILEQQVKKQKEVINNAIKYVEHRIVEDDYMLRCDTDMVQGELLYILKEK